jgi:hypothetical protein
MHEWHVAASDGLLRAMERSARAVRAHSRHRCWQDGNSSAAVLAAYHCPHQFGNMMHEFLNGYAVAAATDRALCWEERRTLACDSLLRRRPWLRPAPPSALAAYDRRLQLGAFRPYGYDDTPRRLACDVGLLPSSHERVVSIGKVQFHQSAALTRHLSPTVRRRALTTAHTVHALSP